MLAGTMVISLPKRVLLADLVEHKAKFVFTQVQLRAYGAFELQVLEELLRRPVTPDAMRLCGEYVPDVERITACMIARKSQLSPECRRFFGPEPEEIADPPVARKPTKAKTPKKPAKPAPS